MTKRRKILLAFAGLVVLGVILWAIFTPKPEPEPAYGGKSLSDWMMAFRGVFPLCERPDEVALSEQEKNAADAIRHIGTNAIPLLLRWIHYEDPPVWKQKFSEFAANTVGYRGFIERQFKEEIRADRVMKVFKYLGSDANIAIPELTRIMNTAKDRYTGIRAAFSLAAIGEDSLPSLLSALTSPQAEAKIRASAALTQMGTNARSAVPALITALKDSDSKVQQAASSALLKIDPDALKRATNGLSP